LSLATSVEDEDNVEQHLNPFGEHQEERGQEEVVQKHRHSRAPVLHQTGSVHDTRVHGP